MHATDRADALTVYERALACLSIRHVGIRRDCLAGLWVEAVADFRSDGLAERDAEKRSGFFIAGTAPFRQHAWKGEQIHHHQFGELMKRVVNGCERNADTRGTRFLVQFFCRHMSILSLK